MKELALLILLCLLAACQGQPGEKTMEAAFLMGQRHLFSQRRPLDSLLTITPRRLSQWDSFYQAWAGRLEASSITPEHQEALVRSLAEIEGHILRHRRDPSVYNLGGALKQVLAARQAPLELRLRAIGAQMRQAAAYYAAARANISAPYPDRCRLAAEKHRLAIDFLNRELMDSLRASSLSEAEALRFREAAGEARIALKDYLAFCESLYFEHQDSLINCNQ